MWKPSINIRFISMVTSTHKVLSRCNWFVRIINKNLRDILLTSFDKYIQWFLTKRNFFFFCITFVLVEQQVVIIFCFYLFFIKKGHHTVTSSFFVLSYTVFYTIKQQIERILFFTCSSMHLLRVRLVSECVKHDEF